MGQLKLSRDRKVSPRGWQQNGGVRPGRWIPTIRNSFGLPSGVSCPGRTKFCESCYAANTEQSKGVLTAMEHNYRLLLEAETVAGMTVLIREMIGRYLAQCRALRLPAADRVFRIHWDGDFFSTDYARAWANVITGCPGIAFWTYTRSFGLPVNVVPILSGIPNLALYLSVDEQNVIDAQPYANVFTVNFAFSAADYEHARLLSARLNGQAVKCPENAGKMPLMSNGRGACVDCRLCVDGRKDVLFATSHREVKVKVRV